MFLRIVIVYVIQISVLHNEIGSEKSCWKTSESFRNNFAYDFVITETLLHKNVKSI